MSRRRWPPRRLRGQAGESLVEVLFSITIMSIAVVGVAGALATAVRISDIHRQQAAAGAALRAFAEALQTEEYVDCAGRDTYSDAYTEPTAFEAQVLSVQYWSPATATFVSSCPDFGVQLVTIEVNTPERSVVETLDVVLRKPCRVGDPPCA